MFIHPLFPQPLPLPLPHPFFPNDAFLVFVRPGRDDCLIFYKWGKPLSSQSCMLCCVYYTGLSKPGGQGGNAPSQFLPDKLTQRWGRLCPPVTNCPARIFRPSYVPAYSTTMSSYSYGERKWGDANVYKTHSCGLTTDSTKGLNE